MAAPQTKRQVFRNSRVAPIVQQPSAHIVVMEEDRETAPKDYCCFSVFTFMFCFCWVCLSFPALVCSMKARKMREEGDDTGAYKAGKTSLVLNIVALVLGLIVWATLIAIFLSGGMTVTYYVYGF